MLEKFGESLQEKVEFNREAEKKYRQEVRKTLSKELSKALGSFGFKKTGYSLWSRKTGDLWHIIYLQRSQFSHQYYIEAGICNENDIPKGEKLDIIFCKERERIEGIAKDIEIERLMGAENAEEVIRRKVDDIKGALNFKTPDIGEQYSEEYFVPSMSPQEAKEKIEKIKKNVREYIPLWFDKQQKIKT